jgi:F-type H+-transporting ATPase subunit a
VTDFLFTMGAAAEAGAGERAFAVHQPQFVIKALQPLGINNMIMTQWAIILLMILAAFAVNRAVMNGRYTKLRGTLEMLIDFLEGWFAGFIGGRANARKYMPLLASLFLFILLSNYSGIFPVAGFAYFAPTGRWGTTLGLAVVVAIVVQAVGIKEMGVKGWIASLLELQFGWLAILMAPLRILEEFVRPFSLSLRLFGNIFAEEILLGVIIFLAPMFVPVPIMGLSLFFGALQAVVFTTLSAIYIGGVLEHAAHVHHHEDHGHGEHGHAEAHATA